jgi:hypothetical protein
LSVDEKSSTHSPNSADTRLSRFLGSGRMTGKPEVMPPGWQIGPDKRACRLEGFCDDAKLPVREVPLKLLF